MSATKEIVVDNEYFSKENSKKDKKSFGQKAKDDAEKRENKRLASDPDKNNPNRNPAGLVVKKKEVQEKEKEGGERERKDKKSSKHWNDKFIQQELQAEEDAFGDASLELLDEALGDEEENEDEEYWGEGPPPLDPEEVERINEFCFQAAMELRSRNDQEMYDFVLKKQLEEMCNISYTSVDNESCEEKTDYIERLRADNWLKRVTISRLVNEIQENERTLKSLGEMCDADSSDVYMY